MFLINDNVRYIGSPHSKPCGSVCSASYHAHEGDVGTVTRVDEDVEFVYVQFDPTRFHLGPMRCFASMLEKL